MQNLDDLVPAVYGEKAVEQAGQWVRDEASYNEETLSKVRDTLRDTGRSGYEADEIIRVLLNVGILFRERT